MRRVQSIAALAIGGALIAAGCEGDGDGGSISKSEFLAKANQICKQGNAQIEATFGRLRAEPSQRQGTTVIARTVISIVDPQIDQIRALGAPEGDEAEVEAMIDDTEKVVDELKANPAKLFGGGGSGRDPFADVNPRLRAYGLTACGQ